MMWDVWSEMTCCVVVQVCKYLMGVLLRVEWWVLVMRGEREVVDAEGESRDK